jgi:hypothetical protein
MPVSSLYNAVSDEAYYGNEYCSRGSGVKIRVVALKPLDEGGPYA